MVLTPWPLEAASSLTAENLSYTRGGQLFNLRVPGPSTIAYRK